jgi:hypothetical protein
MLGYRDAVAATDSPLSPAGARAYDHEFRRTRVEGSSAADNAWHWQTDGGPVTEGFVRGAVHASYLHTHWAGMPGADERPQHGHTQDTARATHHTLRQHDTLTQQRGSQQPTCDCGWHARVRCRPREGRCHD